MDKSFGEILKELREKRGLTVNQFAIYAGVSSGLVSKLENGKRGTPKPETIEKLAKGLKMDYEELMQVAGYIQPEEKKSEETKDPVDKLIEYLDLEFTDEEIRERMNFTIDNITLTDDEVNAFIAFVRAKRSMKMQSAGVSGSE